MTDQNNDITKMAASVLTQAGVHSITIKEATYKIELLPATQSLAIATQLLKVALPAIGAYFDGARNADAILPEDNDMFSTVALLLVGQLDKVSVLDIVSLLTQGVTKKGTPVDVDTEFKGNLGGLVVLLEYILKENCGSFFTDYLQAKGMSLPSLEGLLSKEETPSQ